MEILLIVDSFAFVYRLVIITYLLIFHFQLNYEHQEKTSCHPFGCSGLAKNSMRGSVTTCTHIFIRYLQKINTDIPNIVLQEKINR